MGGNNCVAAVKVFVRSSAEVREPSNVASPVLRSVAETTVDGISMGDEQGSSPRAEHWVSYWLCLRQPAAAPENGQHDLLTMLANPCQSIISSPDGISATQLRSRSPVWISAVGNDSAVSRWQLAGLKRMDGGGVMSCAVRRFPLKANANPSFKVAQPLPTLACGHSAAKWSSMKTKGARRGPWFVALFLIPAAVAVIWAVAGSTGAATGSPSPQAQVATGNSDLQVYAVNRKVSSFPTNEDLSTPETAYANLSRLWASGDLGFWRQISAPRWRNGCRKKKGPAGLPRR